MSYDLLKVRHTRSSLFDFITIDDIKSVSLNLTKVLNWLHHQVSPLLFDVWASRSVFLSSLFPSWFSLRMYPFLTASLLRSCCLDSFAILKVWFVVLAQTSCVDGLFRSAFLLVNLLSDSSVTQADLQPKTQLTDFQSWWSDTQSDAKLRSYPLWWNVVYSQLNHFKLYYTFEFCVFESNSRS